MGLGSRFLNVVREIASPPESPTATSARTYDAARRPRDSTWNPRPTSPYDDIATSLPMLRAKSEDICQNTSIGKNSIRKLKNGVWGHGPRPQPLTSSDDFNELVLRVFNEWSEECDPQGQLDFYGKGELAVNTMFRRGEAFGVFIKPPRSVQMRIPLWLTVYEADMVDEGLNRQLSERRRIVQGVEFDNYDRILAYHFHAQHPGEQYTWLKTVDDDHIRVPAEDVVPLFEKTDQRAGQVRGVPRLASVINDIQGLNSFRRAELMKQNIAACFGIVFEGALPDDAEDGRICDSAGRAIDDIYPGMLAYAPQGSTMKTLQPPNVLGFAEYMEHHEHGISAGAGVPYAASTGNLKSVNFSSSRIGQGYFIREVGALQKLTVVPMWCAPIWKRVIRTAYEYGVITAPVVKCSWNFQKFPSVNPAQDAQANFRRMRDGSTTLSRVIMEDGEDPRAIFKERAAENAKLDSLGLILDSDPRYRTLSGTNQPEYDGGDDDAQDAIGDGGKNSKASNRAMGIRVVR